MFNEIKTHEITVDIVILTIKNDAKRLITRGTTNIISPVKIWEK